MSQDAERSEIIEQVKQCLTQKGMRPSHLADEIGVKRPTFFAWMSGRNWPSIQMREAMAQALGISEASFLTAAERQGINEYQEQLHRRVGSNSPQIPKSIKRLLEMGKGLNLSIPASENLIFYDQMTQTAYFYDPNNTEIGEGQFAVLIEPFGKVAVCTISTTVDSKWRCVTSFGMTITSVPSDFRILGKVKQSEKLGALSSSRGDLISRD